MDLSAGNLRLQFHTWTGMRLEVRGVPVIRESHAYIVTPGWTRVALNTQQSSAIVTRESATAGTAVYETKEALVAFRFVVSPDDTFQVTTTYAAKTDDPLEIEYGAAKLNANILQGAKFSAQTVSGRVTGEVPVAPRGNGIVVNRLAPQLSAITFETRIGRISATVQGADDSASNMLLFDARGESSEWAEKNPVFWMGLNSPLGKVSRTPRTCTVTWSFEVRERNPIEALPAVSRSVPGEALRVPYAPDLPVIPRPKHFAPTATRLRLDGGAAIVIPDHPSEEAKQAARQLQSDFKGIWGIPAGIHRQKPPARFRGAVVWLGLPKQIAAAEIPSQAEGYWLGVRGREVFILGADPRGVYYGAQTLRQLVRVDEQGVYIRGVTVKDWPSLRVRGVHWYGGPQSFAFHRRMMDRIVGPFKMNTMVYEASDTEWESQPKIWNPSVTASKAEVRRTVNYARSHFLEPIPLIQSLGHLRWLFRNDQNLDIVSDPRNPYAYDPTNPRTYDVILPIFQEAIDLFNPRYFHIGHDEVDTTGQFPREGVSESATDLLIADTKRLHGWLKERGVRTMMAGDMLLHYPDEASDAGNATMAEARIRRNALPKDIIITDWHYVAGPDYPSVKILQNTGFDVIGFTWHNPANIQNYSRVLEREKALGLIQSTWAGYVMTPEIVKGPEFRQFVAYLLAAEFAWTGGHPGLSGLGYVPDDAFLAAWDRKPVDRKSYAGFTLDLAGVRNARPWEWLPASDGEERSGDFPAGKKVHEGVTFDLSGPAWLSGALNPERTWPGSLEIPVDGAPLSELHFVWGTTFTAATNEPVARLKVLYTNGHTEEVSIVYGSQIRAFNDPRTSGQLSTVWKGQGPHGQPASARRWTWRNPRPEVSIRSVELVSLDTEAAPVLLAVTGIR